MILIRRLLFLLVLEMAHALKSCVDPCTYANNAGAGSSFEIIDDPGKQWEESTFWPGTTPYKFAWTNGSNKLI